MVSFYMHVYLVIYLVPSYTGAVNLTGLMQFNSSRLHSVILLNPLFVRAASYIRFRYPTIRCDSTKSQNFLIPVKEEERTIVSKLRLPNTLFAQFPWTYLLLVRNNTQTAEITLVKRKTAKILTFNLTFRMPLQHTSSEPYMEVTTKFKRLTLKMYVGAYENSS